MVKKGKTKVITNSLILANKDESGQGGMLDELDRSDRSDKLDEADKSDKSKPVRQVGLVGQVKTVGRVGQSGTDWAADICRIRRLNAERFLAIITKLR